MALNIVERIDDAVAVRHVLISVSDKAGLDVLVPALVGFNPEIRLYSTGGTHKTIAALLGAEGAARPSASSSSTPPSPATTRSFVALPADEAGTVVAEAPAAWAALEASPPTARTPL